MGALLLKKKYLDPKGVIEKIPQDKLVGIVESVKNSMNVNRPVVFLKRCC
jgi:glycine cleavage system H lipoate-binding protein